IFEVAMNGFDQAIMWLGVAKNAVGHSLAERFDDFGRRGEIHVGNPKRVEVGTAIPFDGTSVATGDFLIKVHEERFCDILSWLNAVGLKGMTMVWTVKLRLVHRRDA